MKDAVEKIKGIRQEMLSALVAHGELTVDGMMDQIQGYDRKALASNVSQLVVELLVTRRKDDFTGAPAYRITDLGKTRIKSDAKPTKKAFVTEPAKPVKPSKDVAPATSVSQDEGNRLRVSLKESESAREALANNLGDLVRENSALREAQSAGALRISELSATLEQEVVKAARLQEQLLDTNTEPGKQVAAEQFLIRVPKRKHLIVKSIEKARQHAMSAAMTVGKVEVFAMVEVGYAVRAAVWNQKQA